ncbi:hypothetical protein Acr_27g0002090 [Actinidia rufa]|uniref:Uncharacterized protein n=1 Tax=Actinidia rufa TaxID=165716 RepID=A0A7J0H5V5_9ERIC|nr:hypothetical protein Acr_27g0002090 [Actinidia rufa]
MVRTKHASNDPRGDDPNPAEPEMVFKPRLYKIMDIQRTWLPEFKDRPIITGCEFDRSCPLRYLQKMLARTPALGWTRLLPLPNDVYTNLQGQEIDRLKNPYENLYEQQTAFNKQYSNQMAEVEAQLEGLWVHIIYPPPPPPFNPANAPPRFLYCAPPY